MLRKLCGPVFILAGVLHFVIPKTYEAIMPEYLPAHRELVYASGVAEIAGVLGLLSSDERVRRLSMWWLLATLAAVFPANVNMALNPERFSNIPPALLWARLPFQLAFDRWVVLAAKR